MDKETNDDMNIKIQNASPKKGGGNNKGGCASLAEYLKHEDKERQAKGLEEIPFMKPDGTPVTMGEVIDKIDRNHFHLGFKDDKFYHMIVSPSKEEVAVMGNDEKELIESALILIRAISNAYAENFNREGIVDADNLMIFWKPHFTRGENDELQFHLHAIISRNGKDRDGVVRKLSPLTPNSNTGSGPVVGGFDRDQFYRRCENTFDALFKYERKVAESYDYRNAMAHGTPEQKAEQAHRLSEEKRPELIEKITQSMTSWKEKKKVQRDICEIEAMLAQDAPNRLGKDGKDEHLLIAIDTADFSNKVFEIFAKSADKMSLELALLTVGATVNPVFDANGGVVDVEFIKGGNSLRAKDILPRERYTKLLIRWEQITGQTTAMRLRVLAEERAAKRAAEVAAQQISQHERKLKIGRGR